MFSQKTLKERKREMDRERGFLASSETTASEIVFLSYINNPFNKENQGLHLSMETRFCILRTQVSARWIWQPMYHLSSWEVKKGTTQSKMGLPRLVQKKKNSIFSETARLSIYKVDSKKGRYLTLLQSFHIWVHTHPCTHIHTHP